MKYVKFKGGLGNQLFQYVFLRRLQLLYNKDVKADFSYFNNIKKDNIRVPRIFDFNVKLNIAQKEELNNIFKIKNINNTKSLIYKGKIFYEKLFNNKYFFEKNREFIDINKILNYDYFDGYWQSWKYFLGIEEILRKEISIKIKLNEDIINTKEKIANENSVFIGIRRGDYLSSKKMKNHYGETDLNYYKKAIDYIKNKVKNPKFYIFSNEIEWIKRNVDIDGEVIYRDNYVSDSQELYLMSKCKHSIIGNSTFHWWGAWLNNNKGKIVIAPKRWFADNSPIEIIPDKWIKF
jgi:hypothetical protein